MRGDLALLSAITAASILVGCGGSDSNIDTASSDTVYKLAEENGTSTRLFYGETDHKGLGSLQNVSIYDGSSDTNKTLAQNIEVRVPVPSTKVKAYNTADGSYTDMYLATVSYVADGKAYRVPMESDKSATPIQNSSEENLTEASYSAVKYLGTGQYLVAKGQDGSYKLITPEMTTGDNAVSLGNKKFLTITYPSYGEAIDGYLLYNNDSEKVEKCNLDATSCSEILAAGSRDFEGDIQGTTKSLFLVDGSLKIVDKKEGTVSEVSLEGKEIASGHGTTSFYGGSFYFIATDQLLYRADLSEQKIIAVTQKPDAKLERIRAFMTDWVICGSDTYLEAYKKDGSSTEPVILVENDLSSGYKYVTNFAIGNTYLFVKYTIDKDAKTTYSACLFDGSETTCRKESFWAGIAASKNGKVNFESSYPYTPYAYIRVDNTDNYGGGTLKAIDPAHPLADGITLGFIAQYNFQTFLTNSRYFTETINDTNGIILFAKNDTNFHVDAFYMNLLKEHSLKKLTDTEPAPDVTSGRDHCHGRHCMICHNLAGGKIYTDAKGSKSAYGYRIRLDFEDDTQWLADVAKGKGENFSLTLDKLSGHGNFKAKVLDANDTIVNSSSGYLHQGVSYADCNYCHARDGKTLHGAPGAITISPILE